MGRAYRRGSGRDDGDGLSVSPLLLPLLLLRFPRLYPCQTRSRGAPSFGTGDAAADGVSQAYSYC